MASALSRVHSESRATGMLPAQAAVSCSLNPGIKAEADKFVLLGEVRGSAKVTRQMPM